MTAPTIETDSGKVLERIEQNLAEFRRETNQRFEQLNKDVTDIKIAQARLETEVKGDIKALQGEMSIIKEDIRDIKGSQKAQIWSLIGILGTVALGVGAVVRFVIPAMPGGNL